MGKNQPFIHPKLIHFSTLVNLLSTIGWYGIRQQIWLENLNLDLTGEYGGG